ncbi:MAG TPA: DUF5667 domain-containing protein [Roseiflexaceae bacterium]|nr:DUF5667 domain-containing protein [Roseiflexaceae bacterium]
MTHSTHRSAAAGLAEALDQALARVGAGESPEACLEAFAPYAADLEPLLRVDALLRAEAAAASAALPPEMERWLHGGAREFQAIAERMAPRYARRRAPLRVPRQAVQRTVLAVAVTAAMFVAVDTASAQSLPGEPLYSWKIAREDLSIQLAADAETRGLLHVNYAQRRLAEVDRLAAAGVSDTALIEQTLAGLVSHVQGAVAASSTAEGADVQPALNELLTQVDQLLEEVRNEAPASSTALEATREQIETIAQPLAVEMSTATSPTTPPATASQPASASPTPTERPSSTPQPTPGEPVVPIIIDDPLTLPSATPRPTDAPDNPTNPPRPTSTPVPPTLVPPTDTAPPTDTPQPTSTPTEQAEEPPPPTNTPLPTNTPPPSATPVPATQPATQPPAPTQRPPRTPRPTHTPEPTATNTPEPTATNTPEPTATATEAPSAVTPVGNQAPSLQSASEESTPTATP